MCQKVLQSINSLQGSVQICSVDCNTINTSDILNIHGFLTKET